MRLSARVPAAQEGDSHASQARSQLGGSLAPVRAFGKSTAPGRSHLAPLALGVCTGPIRSAHARRDLGVGLGISRAATYADIHEARAAAARLAAEPG
jgi:hypothetical protein